MNKKIKNALKKVLIVLLIFFSINNFLMSNVYIVYAADDSKGLWDSLVDTFEGMLSTVVGLLTWGFRIIPMGLAIAVDNLTALIAYIDNGSGVNTSITTRITPFEIFFNKVKLIDVNFFDIEDVEPGEDETIVNKIRKSVATWYYVMRNLATVILLVILIYVGIRMLISTVATDKAVYKKMLIDWVASIALIFVIQYIIIFTININNVIVNAIRAIQTDAGSIGEVYTQIASMAMAFPGNINSIAATAIYVILVAQTIGLLFSYFNRMLKIAFLIIISPLITLTYSIDKMGDGKAQALGNWLREFVFTILIQPFHCIIYMCLIKTAFDLLIKANDDGRLARAVLAILCVLFVTEAEKIIRKIFAFKDDSSKTSIAAGLATSAIALQQSKNIAKYARKGANAAGSIGRGIKTGFSNARANIQADAMALMAVSNDDEGKDFKTRKEEALTQIEEKRVEKQINKIKNGRDRIEFRDKYKVTTDANGNVTAANEELQKEIIQKKRSNPGMSTRRAAALVRAEHARKTKNQSNHPRATRIWRARGRIMNDVKNTSTYQVLSKISGVVKAGGIGFFAGAMDLGSRGKIGQAILTGTAGYSITSEYLKNSTKTLTNDVVNSVGALGANTSSQAESIITDIINNVDSLNEESDDFKKILDNIKAELKKAGLDENYIDTIRLDIKKNVKDGNAQDVSSVIDQTLARLQQSEGIQLPHDTSGIKGAAKELSDFENKMVVVSAFSKADASGIPRSSFIDKAAEAFKYDNKDSSESSQTRTDSHDDNTPQTPEERIEENVERAKEEEIDTTEIEDMDLAFEKEVLNRMEEELEKSKEKYKYGKLNDVQIEGLEQEIEELDKNTEKIKEDIDRKIEQINKDIVEKLKERLTNFDIADLKLKMQDVESLQRACNDELHNLEEQRRQFTRDAIANRADPTRSQSDRQKASEAFSKYKLLEKNMQSIMKGNR